MERRFLSLAAALLLGVVGFITMHHFYTLHPPDIKVSDEHGHGPDPGTPEWKRSINQAIRFRAIVAGGAVGLITVATAAFLTRRVDDVPGR